MPYFKLPAGVRDVLPEECRALNAAEERLGRKFAEAGFCHNPDGTLQFLRRKQVLHEEQRRSQRLGHTDFIVPPIVTNRLLPQPITQRLMQSMFNTSIPLYIILSQIIYIF